MPAPSPALVETDPPPLNSTAFPYRVDPFSAQWLAEFGRVIPLVSREEPATPPPNPHRYSQ